MNNEIIERWFEFVRKQKQIENSLEHELSGANESLALNEFYVLYFLNQEENKKLRLQKLQELVGLSQSAMSRLIARLEAKECGVIERSICDKDKRGVYIHLTAKGENTLKEYASKVAGVLKKEL
ncbi:MarR family winged helix-turn-helix transcriptional regulator [Companilactobacillus jidongensis]|uniref:MarR family winged helix-turn-helix transcriptional regulator n=1 Tax=Companilactobacillus jidongensis TaxID=2486006 RepID=UPI001CDCE94C|nr:MarR family transcriptional regulator [Companilactobacillus jidongensis]